MGSVEHDYIPIEHAPVRRGDQDPKDHWIGVVVLSRWEVDGKAEDGCYLEFYDEDWNGELEDEKWFPDLAAARQEAIDRFGSMLRSWRPGGLSPAGREAARLAGEIP
jgi:hypothetical protein